MFRAVQASRLPHAPVWLWTLYALWACSASVVLLASRAWDADLPLCPLRSTTGIPCPLCGGTRAAFSLASLDPIEALSTNPLVAVTLPLLALALALRLVTSRTITLDRSAASHRRVRAALLTSAAALLLLNWAYVAATLPRT